MRDRNSVTLTPIYGQGGTIAYTNSAVNSPSINPGCSGVYVTCTTDAWARFANVASGTAPAATTQDFFCPAGATVLLPNEANTGEPMQLSVIRDAANGSARFSPVV